MISSIIYFVCCLCLILKYLKRNSKKSTLKPPEFSGAYPIIGHSWKLLGDKRHFFRNIISMSQECLDNGGIISLSIGMHCVYLLSDPEDCIKVANECIEKDDFYSLAKPFLGNGLTIADASIWKVHRKLMNPAFRLQRLNKLLVVFNYQAKRLVEDFRPESGRGEFNLEKYLRLNSLESICMSSFGANVAEFGGLHKKFLDAVDEILDIFMERFQKFWLHNNFIYYWSNLKKKQDNCINNIKRFSYAILEKRKKDMEESKNGCEDFEQYTPFMTYLLEISEKTDFYSEEDILHETNTFVSAGYDTTSVTTMLVLIMLGSHPEKQNKVFMELQEVFDNSDRDVTKDDLLRLVYLEATIKETLRLYPIVPFIARKITRDVQLKNYTLEAGKSVGLLVWALHRHPVWGPDAETFRPERWLDGSLPSNSNAFAGFSIGIRDCIGKMYAMISLKTVLSHILRNFEIKSDASKLELELHGTVRLAAGNTISIEERMSTDLDSYLHR